MKQIHAARHAAEAYLVRGFLLSHGISAEVRGEFLTGGFGELPADVCSVWITDDTQYAQASELIGAFLSGRFARMYSGEGWTCAQCGEKLEGQFTQCWNCGAAK
jgi:hypothetical protein